MPKGYVYILKCSDGSYYTGSTIDIDTRITQHNDGKGANHTKKRLPVHLVYLEEFQRIDDAFYREKQIQGWSRVKKEALIKNNFDKLPELSIAHRDKVTSSTSASKKPVTSANKNKEESCFESLSHQEYEKISNNNKNSLVPEVLEGTTLKTFRSNGKLLLTAEYVVLDGAKALTIPTKYGQSLTVEPNGSTTIVWKSFNELGELWFEDEFLITKTSNRLSLKAKNYTDVSKRLIQILKATYQLNPEFLNSNQGYNINTHQDFNRLWGLGTSSTLINNIADWAQVDAYKLLQKTFGGSGYDIACAQHNTAITYQLRYSQNPLIKAIDFNPSFKSKLYFVYLNQKQNSRDGIASYKKNAKIDKSIIESINTISEAIILSKSISEFELLINEHESIISNLIQQDTIKLRLFKDFNGNVKSLGAWGGDFVLVTSENNPTDYFTAKGFSTIIPYTEMV